jgi:hypothetical protein
MTNRTLPLHEELMLLALKDREGTVLGGTMYSYAIGGAVLAELLMGEWVRLETRKKKQRVVFQDSREFGDPLLDEWLQAIEDREKPRTAQDWVQRIAQTRNLKHRVASELSRKGILRTKEDKILGIFSRTVYPELDPGPEREIDGRIERAILRGSEAVDPRTAVLIALAHKSGLLKGVLDKARLKKHKDRIEKISEGQVTAEATEGAIEAMQAAMTAAALIPIMVATTVTTS